jgi:hypothetical protein
MCKFMRVSFIARLGVLGGLSMSALVLSAQTPVPAPASNPVACTFLEWGDRSLMIESGGPQEEQDYDTSVAEFYRQWCTPGNHTADARTKARDAVAVAWKALWERKTPLNTMFHNSGPVDLLAVLGVTHELPALMRTDAALTKEFTEACQHSCFTFWLDPEEPSDQTRLVNLFRLYHDVQLKLKREPAAEPVFSMLKNGKFSLGG